MRRTMIRKAIDRAMLSLTALCAVVVIGVLLILLSYITVRGASSLNLHFLIDTPKPVGEGGGIGNAILGTFVLVGLACAMGIPIGIAAGVYLAELGDNWFGRVVRFVTDTLTGTPSIVTGVFVYGLIVLPVRHFSAFAGGVALAVIMIPVVTRTTEEMVRLVPQSLREGALALGAPQWRVTTGIVLPAAAAGIATGAMLSIARVAGETAPLLFTAFGSRFYNYYLDQPVASLTVQIYNDAISPYDEWHAQAWAATLVLMALVLFVNLVVRYGTRKRY